MKVVMVVVIVWVEAVQAMEAVEVVTLVVVVVMVKVEMVTLVVVVMLVAMEVVPAGVDAGARTIGQAAVGVEVQEAGVVTPIVETGAGRSTVCFSN